MKEVLYFQWQASCILSSMLSAPANCVHFSRRFPFRAHALKAGPAIFYSCPQTFLSPISPCNVRDVTPIYFRKYENEICLASALFSHDRQQNALSGTLAELREDDE
jgi:hypothetical protein